MALVMDPAGDEIRALEAIADWRGKSVLEVGCGDGRLTLRLAEFEVAGITVIDPDSESIDIARETLPDIFKDRVTFQVGSAEQLKQNSSEFDIVVFSWVF